MTQIFQIVIKLVHIGMELVV